MIFSPFLLLQDDLFDVISGLKNKKVFVETNGTIFKSKLIGLATFIVSPKPQFLDSMYMNVLKKWVNFSSFKFVINNKREFNEAVDLCKKIGKRGDIYFMPRGTSEHELKNKMISIGEWIKKDAPYINLSGRLHIYLYGNQRGV